MKEEKILNENCIPLAAYFLTKRLKKINIKRLRSLNEKDIKQQEIKLVDPMECLLRLNKIQWFIHSAGILLYFYSIFCF